jgi:hypothetical protein
MVNEIAAGFQNHLLVPLWMLMLGSSVLVLGGAIYAPVFAAAPRLRSIGLSPWLALLLLIPSDIAHFVVISVLAICPDHAVQPRECARQPLCRDGV